MWSYFSEEQKKAPWLKKNITNYMTGGLNSGVIKTTQNIIGTHLLSNSDIGGAWEELKR